MAMFKFVIYSPYVGANVEEEVEIDDADLVGLTQEEKEDYLNEACKIWVDTNVEYGWENIE